MQEKHINNTQKYNTIFEEDKRTKTLLSIL